MTKIVVFIHGGNYHGSVADNKEVELMIVDYDNEDDSGKRERYFCPVAHDPELFRKVVDGKEN